ncbi:TOMM precursor leader peptide-binding protein [Streptosporangium sp. NPDC000509]|uniref:TOMM precursor leader peptide-binding protein n=1 Tax=Streptosporangium sp. NPDC000509 TaxID=3366186 RepID=UPI0036C6B5FC
MNHFTENGANSPLIGFKRHLRAVTVPGEAVYLTSARGTVALSGEQIQALAPLLDGNHSLAEVRRRVAPGIPAAQLGRLLGRLAEANLVGPRRPEPSPRADAAAEAYWDLGRLDADRAASGLAESSAHLVSLGGVDTRPTAEALRSMDVTVEEDGDGSATLFLVLCDDYLDPELERFNERRLADGRPWLLVKPVGADLWIGPIFRPREGPCLSCLTTRLRAHRRGETRLRSTPETGAVSPPEASLPLTRALGARFAALEAVKWLAGSRDEHQDTVWTLDTFSLQGVRHPVERRPQCSSCGDPGLVAERVGRPVAVASRSKAAVGGNGHRALETELVWERYRHLADPLTGITDVIQRDPRSPSFLHCYLSGPNLALTDDSLSAMRAGLRRQSGGKGSTDLEARVGALCEAVERHCGSRHGDEPTVRGSLRGLGERAVRPDECQHFHRRQFEDRHRWNAGSSAFQHIPEPFDDEEVVDWTPVWSLTEKRQRLLPTDLLYFTRGGHPSLRATSNGNAAGSSVEDAIVQGFLELVERDAVAIWWYNRTRQPAVDLDSFGDPWIADLRSRYEGIGREFWVLDVTSDLGIPVMAAISRRVDKPAEDIMLGFGAHFDPRIAARRALTELGQLLPAVAGARADGTGYGETDHHIQDWWLRATTENQPYLRPGGDRGPRALSDYAYIPRDDLREDVEHIVTLAGRAGLEVLVLDQTRPDIGMPVVKVVVPGLRHFWARFGPGRLYDVPVRLGRLDRATAYEDLNPIPLFM